MDNKEQIKEELQDVYYELTVLANHTNEMYHKLSKIARIVDRQWGKINELDINEEHKEISKTSEIECNHDWIQTSINWGDVFNQYRCSKCGKIKIL